MNKPKHRRHRKERPAWRKASPAKSAPRQRKRRGSVLVLVLAVLLALAGVALLFHAPAPQGEAVLDMAGNPVQPDPDAQATALKANHTSDTGQRFKVPAVDLDVPLGATEVVGGTIAPPGFQAAYWISNLGVSLDEAPSGTVYVATHSLSGGGVAPGNYLIDVDNQRSRVSLGDTISVGNRLYVVTQTQIIPKPDLGAANELWESVPARLVVITCLQNPQNQPSRDNMVITATLS